jgi:hypothetical protein
MACGTMARRVQLQGQPGVSRSHFHFPTRCRLGKTCHRWSDTRAKKVMQDGGRRLGTPASSSTNRPSS